MWVARAYPWVSTDTSVILSHDKPLVDATKYDLTYMEWLLKDERNPLVQSLFNNGPGSFFTEEVLRALWRQQGYTYHVYNARGHVFSETIDPTASFDEWHAKLSCNGQLPLARMFIYTDNDDIQDALVPPKEAMDIYFDPSLLFEQQESGEDASTSD